MKKKYNTAGSKIKLVSSISRLKRFDRIFVLRKVQDAAVEKKQYYSLFSVMITETNVSVFHSPQCPARNERENKES